MFKAVYLDFVHRRRLLDMVTRIWGGGSRNLISISGGSRNFSLLQSVRSGSGAHPTPFTPCTGTFSVGIKRL